MTINPDSQQPDTELDIMIGHYHRELAAAADDDITPNDNFKQRLNALIEKKVREAALIKSDRSIFRILHKLIDEIIEDRDNFSGRDNSSTIIGRYSMKIKNAINDQLLGNRDDSE